MTSGMGIDSTVSYRARVKRPPKARGNGRGIGAASLTYRRNFGV
jgi:hypothetical protein